MKRLLVLSSVLVGLPVAAHAQSTPQSVVCGPPPNWVGVWSSYTATGNPADLKTSTTVGETIGQAVKASGGMAANLTACNPQLQGGSASGLAQTGSSIDGTSTVAGDGTYSPATVSGSNILNAISVTPQMYLPWGTVETDVKDWTPYFQAAINFVQKHGGGEVHVPARQFPYPFLGSLAVSGDNTIVRGDGRGSILMLNAQPADFLTYSACAGCGVRHLTISGNMSYAATKSAGLNPFAVVLGTGTNRAFSEDVVLRFTYSGFAIRDSNGEDRIVDSGAGSLAGPTGILFGGGPNTQSYRAHISNVVIGNVPNAASLRVNATNGYAWKANTAYNVGDVVGAPDGTIWWCSTAGTSGSSGPSGIPGTGSGMFSAAVSDGTARWRFYSNNLTGIVHNSYAYSLVISQAAILGGAHGVVMQDDANAPNGASAPKWLWCWDCEVDHAAQTGINLAAGEGAYFRHAWVYNFTGAGVDFGAFNEARLTDTLIRYVGDSGVHVGSGAKNIIISDNQIGNNCVFAALNGNSYCAGVAVEDGATNVSVNGNQMSAFGDTANNHQKYGIYVAAGTAATRIAGFGNNITEQAVASTLINGTGTGVSFPAASNAFAQ